MSGQSQEEQEQWKDNPCLAARDAMEQGTARHSRGGNLLPREFKQVKPGLGLCLARQERGGMAEGSRDPRNPRGHGTKQCPWHGASGRSCTFVTPSHTRHRSNYSLLTRANKGG